MLEKEIVKKSKGRPSLSTIDENGDYVESGKRAIVIKDPILEPFHIEIDTSCFMVIEKSIVTRGFAGGKASGNMKTSVVGYYTSFKNALNVIAKHKFYQNKKSYNSLKEYMDEWKILKEGVDQIINKLEI